jgi:hypothetical protein
MPAVKIILTTLVADTGNNPLTMTMRGTLLDASKGNPDIGATLNPADYANAAQMQQSFSDMIRVNVLSDHGVSVSANEIIMIPISAG